MNLKLRIFPVVALIVFALSGCSNGGTPAAEESYLSGNGAITFIKNNNREPAPTLIGKTLYGDQFSYTAQKLAVVNVWASWCAPCRAEVPTLVALSNKYPDVQFIGILTRDNLANAEVFAKQLAVPYPNLIDDSLLLGFRKSLPANAIPTTVLIDKKGLVAARISGPVTVAGLSELIERLSAE